ncbi:MAG: DUF1565 domain-containing protein [Deltaproteobacteria bacterium]|nr:DUF1565 domain-containing protein [Deltaproteobacteria bacterium]MBW2536630.1 DUF1565 domain-containing protein [Deltaproteobacteria bacterium]
MAILRQHSALLIAAWLTAGCDEPSSQETVPPSTPDASECADGFERTDSGGCVPILPDEPCPPGQMAVPGETSCRPVAPCGAAPWGDIPIDPAGQFVDASYPGTDSDGSSAHPWRTIGEALLAASDGDVVAIAAGRYAEAVRIERPARLWGRCPELVVIAREAADSDSALVVSASNVEVHQLSVTGGRYPAVHVEEGPDVILDRLWIHDVDNVGISVRLIADPTGLTIRDTLVEQTASAGMQVFGGLEVERCVVRDQRSNALGPGGAGIRALPANMTVTPTPVEIRGSVLERTLGQGVFSMSTDLQVTGTVIRDIRPLDSKYGDGISVVGFEGNTSAEIRDSYVEGCERVAVAAFGADIFVGDTTLECNPIDLNGEQLLGSAADPVAFAFHDLQGNVCGCAAERWPCQLVSNGLAPPEP